ncbi:MAG: energy transducer TonB [Bacteroidota bacterium]
MNKLFLSVIFMLCACCFLNAQTKDSTVGYIEIPPQYPGGEEAMYKFLNENIKYPAEERKNGITGKVIARFVISDAGDVTNITILSKTPEAFNKEVIRVLQLMPKWKPGSQNGKPVQVYYKIPIAFSMPDDKPNNLSKNGDADKVAEYIGIACGIVAGVLIYTLFFK